MEALRDHTTEEDLIARVVEGDAVAFEELVERHRVEVHSVCHRVLGPAEAEDAAQQTFLAAYLAIAKRGERPRHLRRWLRSIAHNESISHLRRRRFSAPIPDEVADGDSAVDQAVRRSEVRGVVEDLHRLPDDQRTALVLSELEERSHREIAEHLECRPGKVKALVYQARSHMNGLRDAREVPCERVRAKLTRRRVGRPPAELARHLETCPSCARFAREARGERHRTILLFPFGAAVEWVRSLFGGGGAAQAAAAAGSAGGGGALHAGLAKVGVLVIAGGAAAGAGVSGVGLDRGEPERAGAISGEAGASGGAVRNAVGRAASRDSRTGPGSSRGPSGGQGEPARARRDAGQRGGGGTSTRPAGGAATEDAGAPAAARPSGTAPSPGPPPTRPAGGKPAGPPPNAAGGPPAGSAATADGPSAAGSEAPGVGGAPGLEDSPAACPLPAEAHSAVC